MNLLKLRRQAKEDHRQVRRELAAADRRMVDYTRRLLRIEAEVEVYERRWPEEGS